MIGKLMVVYDPYFIIPFNQRNYAEKLCKNERERIKYSLIQSHNVYVYTFIGMDI